MNNLGLVLDAIIVLIIVLCIFFSARRGFIRTLIEGIGYVTAIILAGVISNPIAEFIFSNTVGPYLTNTLTTLFTEKSFEVVNDMPQYLEWLMKLSSISVDEITASLESGIAFAVDNFMSSVKPFIINVFVVALFAMTTVLVMMVARIIAKKVNNKCRESSLAKVNRFLGGSIGAIKGIALSICFAFLVSMCILLSGGGFWFITEETLESSYICKTILDCLSMLF